MVTSEVIEILKKYLILLNAEGISVYKAYLFGSYSNGKATDASDIDVMIVSDNYDETDDIASGKIWKLTRRVNTKIEPFLIGKNKFNDDSSSSLVSMIKTEGIEIA